MSIANCVGWGAMSKSAPTRIASLSDLPTVGEVKIPTKQTGGEVASAARPIVLQPKA